MKGQTTCRCGQCTGDIQDEFRNQLLVVEKVAGIEFVIISGFRCETYNKKVGGVAGSAHTRGLAVDVKAADSPTRYAIVKASLGLGITRIGISFKDNFIHMDKDLTEPQDVLWGYS
jgi:zinc D-Ala-D-Ala carboxypeptidase